MDRRGYAGCGAEGYPPVPVPQGVRLTTGIQGGEQAREQLSGSDQGGVASGHLLSIIFVKKVLVLSDKQSYQDGVTFDRDRPMGTVQAA